MWWRSFALMLLSFGSAFPAAAHEGWGIVVTENGAIYVADIPANTIWRISPDGRVEPVVRDKHSHALVLGADGRIYGTHEHSPTRPGEVWRLSPDGAVSVVFTAPATLDMSLHPFLITPEGVMYSTNLYAGPGGPHRLMRRSPAGEITVAVETARGIDGLDIGPDGAIYFTDTTSLKRLSSDGTVTTIVDSLTQPSWGEDLMGLDVQSSDSIYVGDYSGHRVVHVAQRTSTSIFSSRWPWSPTGVVVAGDSIVILEHLRMPFVLLGNVAVGPYVRVTQVSSDGHITTRAVIWGRFSFVAAIAVIAAVAVLIGVRRFLVRRR